MTPGWKTTEFWTTILSKVLTLLALVGFISVNDSKTLEESIGKCVAAVFLFLANAQVVTRYIQSRLRLKTGADVVGNKTPILPLLLLALMSGMLAESTVHAQPLLPYRYQMEQRLKEQRWWIGKLMEMHQPPQAAPSPIFLSPPIAEAPRQLLPVPGEPKQLLPVPGEPRQELPPKGAPKQELPAPGAPKQELPIAPPKTGPQTYTRVYALYQPARFAPAEWFPSPELHLGRETKN